MILAHKIKGQDRYRIRADWPYETYQRRGALKSAGAVWVKGDYQGHWEVDADKLPQTHIERAMWVLTAKQCDCHPTEIWEDTHHLTNEENALVGNSVQTKCGWCDSTKRPIITEVLGEEIWR
jgi:hypothetical protein